MTGSARRKSTPIIAPPKIASRETTAAGRCGP
jgi:hypothetical protein